MATVSRYRQNSFLGIDTSLKSIVKSAKEETMKTKVIEQVEELVKDVTTVEQIAEIERVIAEVKGKILPGRTLGFWEEKTPCWEMFRCPEGIKTECPAFKYRSLPCWEIEGTYSKLYNYGAKGDSIDICRGCRVYKRYGHGESIQIKLLGKGFNATPVLGKKVRLRLRGSALT